MFKKFKENYPSVQKYIQNGQDKGIIGFCIHDDEDRGIRGYVDITPGEFVEIIDNTIDKEVLKKVIEKLFSNNSWAKYTIKKMFYEELGLKED